MCVCVCILTWIYIVPIETCSTASSLPSPLIYYSLPLPSLPTSLHLSSFHHLHRLHHPLPFTPHWTTFTPPLPLPNALSFPTTATLIAKTLSTLYGHHYWHPIPILTLPQRPPTLTFVHLCYCQIIPLLILPLNVFVFSHPRLAKVWTTGLLLLTKHGTILVVLCAQ